MSWLSWIPGFTALWDWLLFWMDFGIVVGIGVLGFIYSPLFKQVFLGVAIGAIALTGLQRGLVSFAQKAPAVCMHPNSDPNGPNCQRWHSTDDRGFGFWEPCKELQ